MNHRPVQEHGPRKLFAPLRAFVIDSNFIPLNTLARAALWLRMSWVRSQFAPELFREQVMRIPILRSSGVREPRQHCRAGAVGVRRQDRFPYHKNTDPWIAPLLQNAFHRGDPPQTHRSSGRKQQNDAHIPRRRIECPAHLIEILGLQRDQRRLSRRNRAPSVVAPANCKQPQHRKQSCNRDAFPFHFPPPDRSASTLAMTCGNRRSSTTISVASPSSAIAVLLCRFRQRIPR
jgi:hypothetical protein